MRFASKIFIVTFLVASSMAFGVDYLAQNYVKRRAENAYASKYSLLAESLGNSLNNLEVNAEKQMYDAAKVVALEDDRIGLLSTKRLKSLRGELGVTHLFIIDSKGNFIRSTNENPRLIPNLYSFCQDYPKLLRGSISAQSMTTPIIPPTPEPKPFKFLSLPNAARTRLIHVGLRVDFIKGTLSKILREDSNIISLSLYAPNGISLGSFSKKGADLSRAQFNLPEKIPSLLETAGDYKIFTKVKSTHPYCCQCDTSGISKNGRYYYILESKISKARLNAELASIRRFFFFVLFLSLIFSFLSARLVSRALVRRLELVTSQIRGGKNSKAFGTQVDVSGKDEIAELASEFNGLLRSLDKAQSELVDSKRKAAIGELSAQVAHDIRSPLAALDSILNDLARFPDGKRVLIRGAVGRIRDIANHLLDNRRRSLIPLSEESEKLPENLEALSEEPVAACLLLSLVEPLIAEKRLQYRSCSGLDIDFEAPPSSYGLFVRLQPAQLKRVLSNLIDNAVEAMKGPGRVSVKLLGQGELASIRIQDRGAGISPEILPKLGREGASFGKSKGSGLGLYHAKAALKSWGGRLSLTSEIGRGTEVVIDIPKTPAPDWFVSELWIYPEEPVVILDDDLIVHRIWRERFNSLSRGSHQRAVQLFHFSAPDEFRNFVLKDLKRARKAVYLVDYELSGHKKTGLDWVLELDIAERSVLVSGRFGETQILEECQKRGVRMIPKSLAGSVPIILAEIPQRLWDAVLIDDDPLVRMTWKLAAAGSGKKLLSFSAASEFLRAVSGISPETPIYIDQELKGAVKGLQAAARISEFGFSEIYLATGRKEFPEEGRKILKGVVGKDPPRGWASGSRNLERAENSCVAA